MSSQLLLFYPVCRSRTQTITLNQDSVNNLAITAIFACVLLPYMQFYFYHTSTRKGDLMKLSSTEMKLLSQLAQKINHDTLEKARAIAGEHGGACLSQAPLVSVDDPLLWQCSEGQHVWG